MQTFSPLTRSPPDRTPPLFTHSPPVTFAPTNFRPQANVIHILVCYYQRKEINVLLKDRKTNHNSIGSLKFVIINNNNKNLMGS